MPTERRSRGASATWLSTPWAGYNGGQRHRRERAGSRRRPFGGGAGDGNIPQ